MTFNAVQNYNFSPTRANRARIIFVMPMALVFFGHKATDTTFRHIHQRHLRRSFHPKERSETMFRQSVVTIWSDKIHGKSRQFFFSGQTVQPNSSLYFRYKGGERAFCRARRGQTVHAHCHHLPASRIAAPLTTYAKRTFSMP